VVDFPAIELQTTFYEPPSMAVVRRWKAQAPSGFRFCLKAWQLITHPPSSPTYRRLKSEIHARERDFYGSFRGTEQVRLAWERTREVARILDADVIVFQCPRSFLPTRENIDNLNHFFDEVERDNRIFAWEPRGGDWTPGLIRDICAENELIHCVDPFESDPVFGDRLYLRLHGKGGYRYRYTDEDLAELDKRLLDRADAPEASYVMFNNIYAGQDAKRFQQRQTRRAATQG
jgi:uncharacterized protein YecE (DUF72 family)